MYYFSTPSVNKGYQKLGAYHGVEIPYIFNTLAYENNNKELEITGLTRYVIATYNELSKNPKDIAKLVKSFPDPTDYVSKT